MKKIHSPTVEGAIYCLLFVAAATYVEARIRPQVLYYWNPELFLKTFAFFRDIALLPGGVTTYADKFLFQLNALPWLGTLSTVLLALLTGVFANRIYSALTGVRSSFFLVVPLFFLLCTLNQFRIVPQTKLLFALVVADVFIHLPATKALLRVCVFFITSCVFLLIGHDLYWLLVALCILHEGAREARGGGRVAGRPEAPAGGAGGIPTRQLLRRGVQWVGASYALLAFALLSVDHRYLYLLHTKVEAPGSALLGAIHRGSTIEAAVFVGLLLLAAAAAYRKRMLSGLALLPILVVGYVDLQTWLASSKGLFCLLLGAPLLSALRSGRPTLKSTRWPAWTRAASMAFLSLVGAMVVGLSFNEYWSSVLRLNLYSATQQWSAVLQEVQKPSLADAEPILVSPFILEALHHTGRLPDDLFNYRQLYPPYAANVTPETLREDLERGKYMVNLQQNARVCFELGLINYAELTAYDLLEYRGDLLSSYQLIALVYLLKGNYEAARHFLVVTKQSLLSSAWADRYLAYADDPRRIESDDYLTSIRSRILLADDPVESLLQRPPFYEIAYRLVAHNPQNRMAREYLMSSYLLNGQVTRIYQTFFQRDPSVAPSDTAALPRVCQEAALVYLAATGQEASPAAARRIEQTTIQDFAEYSEILRRRAAGYPASADAGKFDATYVRYYTSLPSQRQSWANTVDTAH